MPPFIGLTRTYFFLLISVSILVLFCQIVLQIIWAFEYEDEWIRSDDFIFFTRQIGYVNFNEIE